ncbi:MAG: GNAT family N-acetyltransferase [Pseudomonadota bacterium]
MLDWLTGDGGSGGGPGGGRGESGRVAVRLADHTDSELVARFIEGLLRQRGLAAPADRAEIARRFRLNTSAPGREPGVGSSATVEAFLAFVRDQPAGMILFYTSFNAATCRSGLFVEDLYVRDTMRGKGVGRALFEGLAALAEDRQCGHIFFVVESDKERALDQYHRMGAVPISNRTILSFSGPALQTLADSARQR